MLEQRILDFFHEVCPTRPDDPLLVAVSGGPDSVALLHLLLVVRDSLGVGLEAAHLDHSLRGEEGTLDAQFVSELAASEGLTLHRRRVDVPALHEDEGGSIEALARRERYAFLNEARAVAGARWIVTGHIADDQVETFLMNLLRGAGPRGLGGMLSVGPGPMCRPLLSSWRSEILEFLEANDIDYRLDSTNEDLSLTRNRIRHRLVPLLERDFGAPVLRTLARESQLMNDLDEFLSLESDRILKGLVYDEEVPAAPHEIRIDIPGLKAYPRVLERSVIRAALEDLAGGLEEITLAHVDALLELVHRSEGSGSVDLPRGLLARREYEQLVLSSSEENDDTHTAPPASPPLDLNHPGELRWGRVHLRWTLTRADAVNPEEWAEGPEKIFFDIEGSVPPVYLRAVRPGDRLEPKGMEGSQKLSDLFINRKVLRHLRTWVPLLCDNGGQEDGERILWVVGQRRSRHAQVAPETSQVVLFEAETIV
jgi:tRNA(Ile)-lysidine synthase